MQKSISSLSYCINKNKQKVDGDWRMNWNIDYFYTFVFEQKKGVIQSSTPPRLAAVRYCAAALRRAGFVMCFGRIDESQWKTVPNRSMGYTTATDGPQ